MTTPLNKKAIILFFMIISMTTNSFGAKRYWINVNTSWKSTANWSNTSGGTGGFSVPTSTDSVYFDTGSGACNIDTTVNVKLLNVSFGGTITQSANTITIGTGGFTMSGSGTFTGGSAAITITGSSATGAFTLSGGTFQSTTGKMTISHHYNFSGGTFTNNSGEVSFSGTFNITGNTTFYKCTFTNGSVLAIHASTVLTVTNLLTVSGAKLNGGLVYAQGDITQSTGITQETGGSATIVINGSGNQTFTGKSYAYRALGVLCNVKIDKSSGDLLLKDYITICGVWEYVSGNLDITTYNSTLTFPERHASSASGVNKIKGNQTLDGLHIATGYGEQVFTIETGNTVTLKDTLTTAGSNYLTINGGTINAEGHILINNTNSIEGGGSATININGTGNQTIFGASAASRSRLCNITINKTTGTLTLKDYISVAGNWTYTAGTLDITTYNSTIVFTYSDRTISGSPTLKNVSFIASNQSINTISGTITLTGNLEISGTGQVTLNASGTGTIEVAGDISVSNTHTSGGGSALIKINGSGTQSFTGGSTVGQGRLCNVTIDKSSGTLNMSSVISVAGNWNYVNGTVSAGTSTLVLIGTGTADFSSTGGTIMSVYNLYIYTGTRTLASEVGITNRLKVYTGATIAAS